MPNGGYCLSRLRRRVNLTGLPRPCGVVLFTGEKYPKALLRCPACPADRFPAFLALSGAKRTRRYAPQTPFRSSRKRLRYSARHKVALRHSGCGGQEKSTADSFRADRDLAPVRSAGKSGVRVRVSERPKAASSGPAGFFEHRSAPDQREGRVPEQMVLDTFPERKVSRRRGAKAPSKKTIAEGDTREAIPNFPSRPRSPKLNL